MKTSECVKNHDNEVCPYTADAVKTALIFFEIQSVRNCSELFAEQQKRSRRSKTIDGPFLPCYT